VEPLSLHNPPDLIAAKTTAIHAAVLLDSPHIKRPNFEVVGHDDVARLFHLYDDQFFGGWLGKTVLEQTDAPLTFRLSSTMTRAGGKTIRIDTPQRHGPPKTRYEIAIASRLLFMTFDDIQRPVVVCGLTCSDRLQAMQRIMEHEIVHLTELLAWGQSGCKAARFKALAANIFGHADTTHDLVTPRERAAVQHGIKVGDLVGFEFEGTRHVGRVNRIHHRATVLVEAADGMQYSDGKRYKKWYVPLAGLSCAVTPPAPSPPSA
jgi:hypothetical protein